MGEQPKPHSTTIPPVGLGDQQQPTELQKAEAASKAEAEKMAKLKRQSNVEVSTDGKAVTIGIDEYDRWIKDYFKTPGHPGFTPNYTRDDFPVIRGQQLMVSRCYFNKHEGKFVVLDILDNDEYNEAQLKQIQSTLRFLGFNYTWTFRGEETDLETIFETRMLAKNDAKPRPRALVQTNIATVKA